MRRQPAATGFQQPTDAIAPLPAVPGDDATLKARVAQDVAHLDTVKTLTGRVIFDEWKDKATEHGEASIAFRAKPFAARVDVLDSNRWLAAGGALLWSGGTRLKIRPFRMPFSMDFAYDNGQVVSVRGYRIDQTDLFSMAKVLKHPAAQIRSLGTRTIKGHSLTVVEVKSPASCPGITREVIGLHDAWHIPSYREMYAGDRLVHRGQGFDVRLDVTIAADRFKF